MVPIRVLVLMMFAFAAGCAPAGPLAAQPAPKPETLIFYNWADDVPPAVLERFTAETGIRIDYRPLDSMEEAAESIRSGAVYDLVSMDTRFIKELAEMGLLAKINPAFTPNFRHIAVSFRNLEYDPENRYSLPYSWGTTGILVRTDLVSSPVDDWYDLCNGDLGGKIAFYQIYSRDTMGAILKCLGLSPNTTKPDELAAVEKTLMEMRGQVIFPEDYGLDSCAPLLTDGRAVACVGYSRDALLALEETPNIEYVIPESGALLWAENFVIPSASPNQEYAALLVDYFLRPEIAAEIVEYNFYATPNQTAQGLLEPSLRDNQIIFPSSQDLKSSLFILKLEDHVEEAYMQIWNRFLWTTHPAAPKP